MRLQLGEGGCIDPAANSESTLQEAFWSGTVHCKHIGALQTMTFKLSSRPTKGPSVHRSRNLFNRVRQLPLDVQQMQQSYGIGFELLLKSVGPAMKGVKHESLYEAVDHTSGSPSRIPISCMEACSRMTAPAVLVSTNQMMCAGPASHTVGRNRASPVYRMFAAAQDGCLTCVKYWVECQAVSASSTSASGAHTACDWALHGIHQGRDCECVLRYLYRAVLAEGRHDLKLLADGVLEASLDAVLDAYQPPLCPRRVRARWTLARAVFVCKHCQSVQAILRGYT